MDHPSAGQSQMQESAVASLGKRLFSDVSLVFSAHHARVSLAGRQTLNAKYLFSQVTKSWWVFVILSAVGAGAAFTAVTFFPSAQNPAYYEGKVEGFLVTQEEAAYGEGELLRSVSYASSATVYLPPNSSTTSRASFLREMSHSDAFVAGASTTMGVNPQVFPQLFSVEKTDSSDILTIRAWGKNKNRSEQYLEAGLKELEALDQTYFSESFGGILVLEEKSSNPVFQMSPGPEEAHRLVFRFIESAPTSLTTRESFPVFHETSTFLPSLEAFLLPALSREERAILEADSLTQPLEFSISESGLVVGLVRQGSLLAAQDWLEILKREFLNSPDIYSHDGNFQATVLFGSADEPVLVGQVQSVNPILITTASGLIFGLVGAGILVAFRVSRQHPAAVERVAEVGLPGH